MLRKKNQGKSGMSRLAVARAIFSVFCRCYPRPPRRIRHFLLFCLHLAGAEPVSVLYSAVLHRSPFVLRFCHCTVEPKLCSHTRPCFCSVSRYASFFLCVCVCLSTLHRKQCLSAEGRSFSHPSPSDWQSNLIRRFHLPRLASNNTSNMQGHL